MTVRRLLQSALVGTLLVALPFACSDRGVVGGKCAEGLTECNGVCVSLDRNPAHCGVCGNACPMGAACVGGVCGGDGATVGDGGDAGRDAPLDAAEDGGPGDVSVDGPTTDAPATDGPVTDGPPPTDAPTADGPLPDGSVGDGPVGDGAANDGAVGDGASDGTVRDGAPDATADACNPPFDTPAQCGDCFTRCTSPTPLCQPVGSTFTCVPLCNPPLVECNGRCVDANSDPRHCGRCNRSCPTGLCQGGMCVGATVGHVVTLCMDYQQSNQSMNRLLTNAVLLPFSSPVRVLAWDEHVPAGIRTRVDGLIAGAQITHASTVADVVTMLNVIDFDTFLAYDQRLAPAGELANAGATLAATLDAFASAGGTVVTLSSTAGVGEMADFLSSSGLLPATDLVDFTAQTAHVRAPADAVGVFVLSPYLARRNSCTFTTPVTSSQNDVFVVTDTPSGSDAGFGRPVVVHRIEQP